MEEILLTNAKGTAHPEVGSIDKMNTLLSKMINIPSICWWRDDLVTLTAKDQLFMWSYPEILNGQQVLNLIMFSNVNEEHIRRQNIIKSYLEDQYEIDSEVKFKQIELQNNLFDLFIDIPINIKKFDVKNKKLKSAVSHIFENGTMEEQGFFNESENTSHMAAAFLLGNQIDKIAHRIVLEGGPGQGKSTISQYVCQINRVRLLNNIDIKYVPEAIKSTSIKLPFKIDLRDFEAWITKKNPYTAIVNENKFNEIWQKSLESFLVGHIIYHTKFLDVSIHDLIEICKLTPPLFVFDGFDEVADLQSRKDIVLLIENGIKKFETPNNKAKVIITSRPAAFSNNVEFSAALYPHFILTEIDAQTTEKYVNKWIHCKKLTQRDSNNFLKLFLDKIKLPHIRVLAKSPMQLAILLSLLNTKGDSLPNKRTALFESYIDLLFNREAEKNITIRDQRDLIDNIHQYLAWVLHSQAEYQNSGSMKIKDIKSKLREYLSREGHDPSIADNLFDVMQERVCALVSRVQGTFEFEVQPLREFFCAKYLKETTPYSNDSSSKDSLPERFDAIVRNSYWQNVVRFFSGFLKKGELPMLSHQLGNLYDDKDFKFTSYPSIITIHLLSDMVFTQYPTLLKPVARLIIKSVQTGKFLKNAYRNNGLSIAIPIGDGIDELVDVCFNELRVFPVFEYAKELINILVRHNSKNFEKWTKNFNEMTSSSDRTLWLKYAYYLELIHQIDIGELISIIDEDDDQFNTRIQLILQVRNLNFSFITHKIKQKIFNGILNNKLVINNGFNSYLAILDTLTSHYYYSFIMSHNNNSNLTMLDIIKHISNVKLKHDIINNYVGNDAIDELIFKLSQVVLPELNKALSIWFNNAEPWENIIDESRNILGDCVSLNILAIMSSGIKSKTTKDDKFYNLWDTTISLCKRTRYARLSSGNTSYWTEMLQHATSNKSCLIFVLLNLLSWATIKTIVKLEAHICSTLDNLEENEFNDIVKCFMAISRCYKHNKTVQNNIVSKIKINNITSPKLLYLISFKFQDDVARLEFIYNNVPIDDVKTFELLSHKLDYLLMQLFNSKGDDSKKKEFLEEIKIIYIRSKHFKNDHYISANWGFSRETNLSIDLSRLIISDCKSYPLGLSMIAESTCMEYASKNTLLVKEIADKNGWAV